MKNPIYLSRTLGGSIITVAKVSEKGVIELGGGCIETTEPLSEEDFDIELLRYENRGFLECSKDIYDDKCKSIVKEINDLV